MTAASDPRVVTLAPLDLPAHPLMAQVLRLNGAMAEAALAEAAAAPEAADKFMRVSSVLQAIGQDALALRFQSKALAHRRVFRVAAPKRPAVRLLGLLGPGTMMDNTPLEFLVENGDVQLDLLYLSSEAPFPERFPDHDVAFVAVGESAANRMLLLRLAALMAHWPRAVLNRPEHVLRCGRDSMFDMLHDIPGLLMPRTRRVARAVLGTAEFDFAFPYTLRPLDTQAGIGLERIGAPAELEAYLAAHAQGEFYASAYVDYSGADGLFRKARVALIGGRAHACHLAASGHWVVHYRSAGMEENAARREEEALWMRDFDAGFGARHAAALAEIARRTQLDYLVLDCAQARDGSLLLFEADTRSWIHAIDPVEIFPYKPAVMQRAFDGFRALLLERASRR